MYPISNEPPPNLQVVVPPQGLAPSRAVPQSPSSDLTDLCSRLGSFTLDTDGSDSGVPKVSTPQIVAPVQSLVPNAPSSCAANRVSQVEPGALVTQGHRSFSGEDLALLAASISFEQIALPSSPPSGVQVDESGELELSDVEIAAAIAELQQQTLPSAGSQNDVEPQPELAADIVTTIEELEQQCSVPSVARRLPPRTVRGIEQLSRMCRALPSTRSLYRDATPDEEQLPRVPSMTLVTRPVTGEDSAIFHIQQACSSPPESSAALPRPVLPRQASVRSLAPREVSSRNLLHTEGSVSSFLQRARSVSRLVRRDSEEMLPPSRIMVAELPGTRREHPCSCAMSPDEACAQDGESSHILGNFLKLALFSIKYLAREHLRRKDNS